MQPKQGEAPPQPPAQGAGARVLVVDDDESLWRLACRWLQSLGYVPVGVSSPTEAIQRLAAEPFDLLLTDIAMPGSMDGVALARFAKERYPKMRLLLASAYASQMLVDSDLPANVLAKPYQKEDLAAAVALALRT